jgi:hypothetical protein
LAEVLEKADVTGIPAADLLDGVRAAAGHLGGSFEAILPALSKAFGPAHTRPSQALDRLKELTAACPELLPLETQVRVLLR